MKVLWFEVTEPSSYQSGGAPLGGWQDSLERIVRTIHDVNLTISFISEKYSEVKVVNGVTYAPIKIKWNHFERRLGNYWDKYIEKMLPEALRIVENYKPDLIQVFGTEWLFGQIAANVTIPVVIHIMGAIVPYNNAWFPPGYSKEKQIFKKWWNPRIWLQQLIGARNRNNWSLWEERTWSIVNNYMGRTNWDESLSRIMNPDRRYFHVEEALRSDFLSAKYKWTMPQEDKIRIVSTGCKTFWKGPDMMLKVAHLLTKLGVDFEWQVVGQMDTSLKRIVEENEHLRFDDCNVHILGYKQHKELIDILCNSSVYVHTAYIENSPNSICEAQCIGVPVISTNVGGISSLIRNGVDGELVPANDPWQMADAIIQLSKDKERMKRYSQNGREIAQKRHDDEHIKAQLLECYHTILDNKEKYDNKTLQ